MKDVKQVQKECEYGTVFLLDDFADQIDDGSINEYDGIGYFHNGEKETNISVWDRSLTWEDIKDYPYVCWYNK